MNATTHTVELKYPVEFQGHTVAALGFRRPKVRDLRALTNGAGSDEEKAIKMMADLCERPVELLEELDPVDFTTIQDWLEPILDPKGRAGALKP